MLQVMFPFLLAVARTNSSSKFWLLQAFGIMERKDFEFMQKFFSASLVGNWWRAGLATAIACYNVWFWFMFETPTSCRVYIFLFAKTSPQPTSQQIYRILAIIYLIWRGSRYSGGGLTYLSTLVSSLHKGQKKSDWKWPRPRHLWLSFIDFDYERSKIPDEKALFQAFQRHQWVTIVCSL